MICFHANEVFQSAKTCVKFEHLSPVSVISGRISTCCDAIDKLLNGGIPRCGITEIVGKSGSGKSQLAMQLLASSAASAPDAMALYLGTETDLRTGRLLQIATRVLAVLHPAGGAGSAAALLQRVLLDKVPTVDTLRVAVTARLPSHCHGPPAPAGR